MAHAVNQLNITGWPYIAANTTLYAIAYHGDRTWPPISHSSAWAS